MIELNKAVLHILDFTSDISVFSQEELNIGNHIISEFLIKHIEKSINDPGIRSGEFLQSSKFETEMNKYLQKNNTFLEFSTNIAEIVYSNKFRSEDIIATDIIFCDFFYDGDSYIGLIELSNTTAYTHQVMKNDNIIRNEIINHYSILPNTSQKLSAFAFINTGSGSIKFIDKKSKIDGNDVFILPELVLQCTSMISSKDTVKIVKKIVNKIAEENGQNSAVAISKAKKYIAENSEVSEKLEPLKLGREVFGSSSIMQDEFKREIANEGIPVSVPMEKSFAVKTGKNHKIKTDTGIEITFPADYFENQDFIEFVNNSDGTLSIEIKNIGKITNK